MKRIKCNRSKSRSNLLPVSALLTLYDVITIALSYFLALWFRFDCEYSAIPRSYFSHYLHFVLIYIVLSIGVYYFFKLYQSIWRYASVVELSRVVYATAVTGAIHAIFITTLFGRMPISYYCMGIMFQFIFTITVRFMYRFVLLIRSLRSPKREAGRRVMVVGGGDAGRGIIRELMRATQLSEDFPVCIIDDDPEKWNKTIDGIPIVGGRNEILSAVKKFGIDKIFVALPTAKRSDIRDILNICNETGCELKSLPGTFQLINGEVTLSALKEVSIEDLLGREQIKVNMDEIFNQISGKVVLITGGGGSIGSEISLQVSRHSPKKLIIFDVYENNAYAIQHKILKENPSCNLEVLIGSVRDSRRVNDIFKKYRPDIVYHAAAHKHVPLMEDSPCEAVKNNVIGTYKVAYTAMMYGVHRFVLISTDKAVNPTNVMGATKRLCELVIQSFDKMIKENRESEIPVLFVHEEDENGSMYPLKRNFRKVDEDGNPVFIMPGQDDLGLTHAQTEFIGVRFGNVLGSNGSVIPLFKDQIASGGPVTVTHPDIIRYFMTIPEAASLVLQAGAYAKGGELFILDMGEPVKIVDLAKNLIRLSGLEPDVDIKIEYTGLRPGEKLYEEKLMSEEGLTKTPNDLIHIGKPVKFDEVAFLNSMNDLMTVSYENSEAIRLMIEDLVSTYHPSSPLSDEQIEEYRAEIDRILHKNTDTRRDNSRIKYMYRSSKNDDKIVNLH